MKKDYEVPLASWIPNGTMAKEGFILLLQPSRSIKFVSEYQKGQWKINPSHWNHNALLFLLSQDRIIIK